MPPLLSKEEQGTVATAIIEFLNRKPNLPAKAKPEEIDGFRVLRREAVRALAQIHIPSVSNTVRPALMLARFAAEDASIQPPPRIDERLEAAIGLARMRSADSPGYQVDYAANAIAKFIGAFGALANNERDYKTAVRHRPWKIDAARANEALAVLRKDSPKDDYLGQVVARGTKALQAIAKGDLANAGDLGWLANPDNVSPNKELFKGAADTVVKPAKPAETPEK
jgi:hypothetical protein